MNASTEKEKQSKTKSEMTKDIHWIVYQSSNQTRICEYYLEALHWIALMWNCIHLLSRHFEHQRHFGKHKKDNCLVFIVSPRHRRNNRKWAKTIKEQCKACCSSQIATILYCFQFMYCTLLSSCCPCTICVIFGKYFRGEKEGEKNLHEQRWFATNSHMCLCVNSVEKEEIAPNTHHSATTFNVTVMLNWEFCFETW